MSGASSPCARSGRQCDAQASTTSNSSTGRGYSQREEGRRVGRCERTIRSLLRDVDGFRQAIQAVQGRACDLRVSAQGLAHRARGGAGVVSV